MAGEPKIGEVELLAAIDLLKKISAEEREAVILALEHDHPGIGDRARAALALEERKVVKLRVVKSVERPEVRDKQGNLYRWVNGCYRRQIGVAQLKTIEQAKPEPEKPEPEAEPEQAKLPAIVPAAIGEPVGAEWNDAIAAMNKQHAIIDNVGGRAVIASWEPASYDQSKLVIVFQNKESFLLRYSNRFVWIELFDGKGSRVRMGLGQWWLSHRDRQQYRGVLFKPGAPGVVNECLNLWQGWGVEAIAGDWGLIRKHVYKVVAGGNKEFGDYVVRWIAWAIQHPDRHAEAALVLIGLKGVGKGTLVRCLRRIFGVHAFQVTSQEEVIGKFNAHLQDCVLFIADEAYWGGDKRCVGRLQGMITEGTLPLERKGIDMVQVPNYLHVMMLAEPGWVIPAGKYERRYAALAVAPVKRGDKEYFRALHKQIDEGGVEAMFYDLRRMDLGDWHPRDIPEELLSNPALQKQQVLNLPPLEQWFVLLLHDGVLPGALSGKLNTAFTKALLDDARERVPRLKWNLSEVSLRNFLVDEESVGVACIKYRAAIGNGWSFAPLAELREAWCRRYGPTKWDSPAQKDWGVKKIKG